MIGRQTGCSDCGGPLDDGECPFCRALERVMDRERMDGIDDLQEEMKAVNETAEAS
jgi:hypothetical protein